MNASDIDAAKALAARIAPEYASKIAFEQLPDGSDRFELEGTADGIVIRGNSANSMAVGLNHYLKYYCLADVSWYAADPVQLPELMPAVPEKVSREARVDKRFFLNYCTFGYTMPWWQWADWERFIDWMALQGINLPLAITGQEAVWYRVWQEMGLTDEEIRSYFTGPAHLPWHRMLNLDAFQGNLPDSWLKHQEALQKQIVERERELGMKPVLPAFAGHVPAALRRVCPDAKISQMSKWGGFRDCFRSSFLDPMDPLFAEIQKSFLKHQTELYGTDHIYGVDPFNEVDPPSWEPEFLARAGEHIYKTLADADPDAVWLQMTWLFYYAKKNWTPERIEAYITSVPSDRIMLLDYYCDRAEVWRETQSFHGQPYIWCYLGNFGGNTMLAGELAKTGRNIELALAEGGSNFSGVGSTAEALDINPLMYEYIFEKAWTDMPDDAKWIEAYADRRLGRPDDNMRDAWRRMAEKIYVYESRPGQATLTNCRPALEGYARYAKADYKYSNADLYGIWGQMIASADATRDAVNFDLVNVGRQVLGNHFKDLREDFTKAYRAGDFGTANAIAYSMRGVLADMDELLGAHGTFLFGKWLEDAKSFAATPDEAEYYATNARTLLTTWGERNQSLNDYANRSWNGLTDLYYAPRWNMFLDSVLAAMAAGEAFDEAAFKERVMDFEATFAATPCTAPAKASGSALDIARRLHAKYSEIAD